MDINDMFEYNNLNEDIKKLLKKAMDIYSTIQEKEIEIEAIEFAINPRLYKLNKLDKKIISIYIASFLTEGDLKNLFDEYDDIRVNDLFDFINLKTDEIISLKDDDYKSFYDSKFKSPLLVLYSDYSGYGDRNITPEVILDCIAENTDSSILNYFIRTYTDYSYIYSHPSFKNIKINLSKSKTPSSDFSKKNLKTINEYIENLKGNLDKLSTKKLSIEDEESEPEEEINSLTEEKLWELLSNIQNRFIGQEIPAEFLFYNIINNQELANKDDVMDGERSIIFLDGPTGTGKTGITRAITDELDIPFTRTSITNYSSTGYVGGNITDTLKDLLKKADGDLEKAQRGIIVFDEFDKIAYSRGNGSLEMKKAVQQQLLDFMGGGKYNVSTGSGLFGSSSVEFDTSKLTFICLAALTDLREDKTIPKNIIGFGEQNSNELQEKEYTITPQDLINIGIERELVGRFNTYLHTNPYSKESLLKILKESTISPMIGFEKWVSSKGKKLEIADDTYGAIVDAAYDLNTGARSLQTIVNNIRTPFIKEVMRGDSKVISLDADVVKNITDGIFERKDRK